MTIKHKQSDPAPEKADPCPFCVVKERRRKLGLLQIDREEGTPDAGQRWVYCRSCKASGPAASDDLEAVRLWNLRAT